MSLMDEIIEYVEKRKYVKPNVWQAMGWVNTEVGEVYELLLQREAEWVRNNPENKPTFSKEELAEELGDVIFMVMLAGYAEGVNPLEAAKSKMKRKLEERVSYGVSSVVPVTDKEAEKIFKEFDEQDGK